MIRRHFEMTPYDQLITNGEYRNILFLYHRLDILGGIETRWIDEFSYLQENRYRIHLFVPKKRCNYNIAKLYPLQSLITTDINEVESATEFVKLVNEIISTIRTNNISMISIHMFDLFSFASVMAAQICRIPILSTIHGTPDIYRKPIQRLLFQQLADRSLSLSISVSQHLKSIYKTQAPLSIVIPNMINLDKYKHQHTNLKHSWLMINRISSEKYPSILRFLKAADAAHITQVDIAGGGNQKKLRRLINKLNINTQVSFLGEINDISILIPQYSGIAGMGRAVIEGLACQKPVCVMSPEGELIGLVTKQNFQDFVNYNFIGKTLAPISDSSFLTQLNTHTAEDSKEIYYQLESNISVKNWPQYIEIYQKAEFIDNPALESLYHKLAYFSVTLSKPFIYDKFFQQLLYDTLIEYDLEDIRDLWQFYEEKHGLNTRYPNPLKVQKSYRKKWWNKLPKHI